MIFGSYRFQFKSYLEWLFFTLAKKLHRFPKIQSITLMIGYFFFKDRRFQALGHYVAQLNGNQLQISSELRNAIFSEKSSIQYDLLDLYGINYVERAKSNSFKFSFPDQCVYTFGRSGFFSMIFTAINILFFCKQHNIRVSFDWKHWPYDFDPSIFFGTSDVINGPNYSGQDDLFNISRAYLDSLELDSHEYQEFRSHREEILGCIYSWCKANFDDAMITSFSGKTACFIRRGDKLIREAYPISSNAYLLNLKNHSNVVVLGDDFYFDNDLCVRGNFKHFYANERKLSGGNLSHVDKDAVNSILANYYLLCSSKNIIGDPSCNLVAAALMYKGVDYSCDRKLYPWRLRKYV